jgi:TRAP-type uncharacterized transport system fused permease subunit
LERSIVVLRKSITNPRYVISRDFFNLLENGFVSGAKSAMSVAAACAAMGAMAQAIVMSGLAFKIVFLIKDLAGGNQFFALVLTMAVAIFFGMGVPTTASYTLIAIIAAPALAELGFEVLSVHLFIYYYAILANITPPVCSAVLVGAQIAGGNYMKTGFRAIRIGITGFILPFIFCYHTELLLIGNTIDIITTCLSAFFGVTATGAFFEGYFYKETRWLERIVLLIAGVLLIYPGNKTDVIGYMLLLFVFLKQYRESKKQYANIIVGDK